MFNTTVNLRKKNKSGRGFTMIEMIISMVALLILMAIVYYLFSHHAGQGLVVEDQIGQQHDARMALQLISRDLRSAHHYEFAGSKLNIHVFRGKPTVSFDGNGNNAAFEKVEYFLEGGELFYNNITTSARRKIAKNVTSFNVFSEDDYVAVKFEAEVEVMFERQTYSKVNTMLFTKVFPRFVYQAKKYDGFFSLVDKHGDY
jgi:prepilin-type N-terminal cleavage/methylation domain-containing protein